MGQADDTLSHVALVMVGSLLSIFDAYSVFAADAVAKKNITLHIVSIAPFTFSGGSSLLPT